MQIEIPQKMITAVTVVLIVVGILFLFNIRKTQEQKITSPVIPLSIKPGFRTGALKIGEVAPDFEVKTLEGEKITLKQITESKKLVLLLFSATWCPSCKVTLEAAKSVYPKYKDKVMFIDVDVDLTEPEEAIRAFRDSNGYPVTFAVGNKDVLVNYKIISTSIKYGIKDGIIVYSDVGPLSEKDLEEAFQRIIG
jgi:peroxiredoxin